MIEADRTKGELAGAWVIQEAERSGIKPFPGLRAARKLWNPPAHTCGARRSLTILRRAGY